MLLGLFCLFYLGSSTPFQRDSFGRPFIELAMQDATAPIFLTLRCPPASQSHPPMMMILPLDPNRPMPTPLYRSPTGSLHLSIEWMLQHISPSINLINGELIFGTTEADFLHTCIDQDAIRLPRIPSQTNPLLGRVGFQTPDSDLGQIKFSEPHNSPYLNPNIYESIVNYFRTIGSISEPSRRGGVLTFNNCTNQTIDELYVGLEFVDNNTSPRGRIYVPLSFSFDSARNTCTLKFRSTTSTPGVIASFSPLSIPDTNVRITASTLSICDSV